jgi:hypothetical protein
MNIWCMLVQKVQHRHFYRKLDGKNRFLLENLLDFYIRGKLLIINIFLQNQSYIPVKNRALIPRYTARTIRSCSMTTNFENIANILLSQTQFLAILKNLGFDFQFCYFLEIFVILDPSLLISWKSYDRFRKSAHVI